MSVKTGMNQVKFKVRYNALILREFTVSDMIRATGLNPESIRTELQRMKQEGLLIAAPHPEKHDKRGGHPSIYRLTDDPEMRLALSESIEAFYPPLPVDDQPTSRHYASAKQLIDRAQTADGPQCKQLLAAAEHDLEIAEQAEGGSLASDSVKAYLQYERARVAYLRRKDELAQELFSSLSQFFASTNNTVMVRKVHEFQLCLVACTHQRELGVRGNTRPIAEARCLLDAIEEVSYVTDSPLALLLMDLLSELSQTMQDRINAAAFERAKEFNERDINAIKSQLDEIQLEVISREFGTSQSRQETERIPAVRLPELKSRDRMTVSQFLLHSQPTRHD
jgi:hypothetical protein